MWDSLAGAAVNIGGTLLANNANAQSAKDQMKFQKMMSDTAHQRETKDLRAAGLNPILSANAGASTPGGASYNAQAPSIDPMMFQNVRQSKATIDNTKMDTGLKAANTKSAEKSIEIADETKKLIQAQTVKEQQNARSAHTAAQLAEKYGEASSVMGLINSGTGSIGNLLGIGNNIKNLFGPNNLNKVKENYSPAGEHRGTTHERIFRD
ncbi:MAG: DNA pilot protein [Wigfec virus K19_174]|nr:MAG: DNA pilot protein [Wigfec virus K19_174]